MSKIEFNDLCIEGMKKVEPTVSEYRYTVGEKDFRTLLLKAYNDRVDTLMTIGFDYEYVAMFKQLSELGYPIKMMCATANECIFPDVVTSSSPKVLDGTLSIDFISPNISQTKFAEKYRAKYPNPSFTDYAWGAIGYEEIQLISKAMAHCNPGDSQCLIKELENVKGYETVIDSNGFVDRVLQINTKLHEFRDGSWQEIIN